MGSPARVMVDRDEQHLAREQDAPTTLLLDQNAPPPKMKCPPCTCENIIAVAIILFPQTFTETRMKHEQK